MRDRAPVTSQWDSSALAEGWDLVLPPSRPSARQLVLVRDALTAIDRQSPVGVLGSTPELRDLLFELGFVDVYVFDKNRSFHEAMTEQRVHRSRETLVEGDWLDTIGQSKGVFGALLSDLTMGNVPYARRSDFYAGVASALRRGGVFYDKVLTHPIPHLSIEPLLRKYDTLPTNWLHVNEFSCEVLFCSELLNLSLEVDTTRFYEILSVATSSPRIRTFCDRAKRITPPACRWCYGRPWQELEPDYCPQLGRVATHEDEIGSPYYGRVKHFVLARVQ